MLWRAGSGHRHTLLSPFRAHPKWIFAPCSSKLSTALPSPPPSPNRTEGENLATAQKSVFTGRIPRHMVSKFPLETSKFLATIEAMASTTMDRDQILERLPDSPSNVLENSKKVCAFAQEVIEKKCPDYALHLLHIAQRLGIRLRHNQYEQVVYRLLMHKYFGYAYRVAAIAKKYTGRWTVRLLNFVARSHVETHNYALLDGVLDLFEGAQLQPTRSTYHILVRGHLQNADLARARNYLRIMQEAGFEMDKVTYLSVLGAYRPLGPNDSVEEQAFQTLRGTGSPSDTIILNAIMQLRIDAGDTTGALRVLELFALPPLDGGQENGYGAATPPMASSSSKTLPDSTTFNILLGFLAQQKDSLQNVLRVFGKIPVTGLRVDVDTVAALIRAYFTNDMAGTAIEIVAKMCASHDLSVDPREFRLLGCGADTLGAPEVHALSVCPTTHIFNTLLQGVLPTHNFVGMRRVLRIMRQAGVSPDASTTQIILSYLHDVQHMRPRSLIRVLRTLAAFPTDQVSLTIQHTNTILRALLRREREIVRTKSWNATAQRVRFGHRPPFSVDRLSKQSPTFDPTVGIALASFGRSVSKLFAPVIQSLLDRKVMSDAVTFSLGIRRNALMRSDLGSARRLFDIMVARGIRPNAYHFSALMEGHVAQGDMDGAKEVMHRAAASGIEPNVVMYTILIIGYGRLRRPDLALRTFGEMRAAGVDPDFAAVDAVVSGFWVARDYGAARRVLLDLWQLVAQFPSELADAPLRVLVQAFRALRPDSTAIRPSDSLQWRPQRLRVKREMGRTFAELRQWRLVLESVSWAKGYVDLSPMLHGDVPAGGTDQY